MKIMRSMTGFGRSVQNNEKYNLVWEIRSVNSRFLDIKWKLPPLLRSFEARFEKVVRLYATRGRVEVCLTLQETNQNDSISFDTKQAQAMLFALEMLARERKEDFTVDYNQFLKIPSLWQGNEEEVSEEFILFVQNSLELALQDWNNSREEEAKQLRKDLESRFNLMQSWLQRIVDRAPQVKELRFQSVKERLQEVLQNLESTLDENRFLQEIVILSDRLDITEECTRLESHLKRLSELMDIGEDVGRKLDFTLQECFREINTCGNKIQDAVLSTVVVDYKNELEKCREQVQNLE